MAMIRIQFHRQACPLPALLANFGTDEQCTDALGASHWPQGFSCPGYGNTNYYLFKAGKHKNFQYKCCWLQTSLTAGTLFQCTHLSLSDWFLAIYLISQVRIGLAARQAGTPRTRYLLWRPFLSVPKAVSCILNGTGTWLYAQSNF